MSSVASNTLSRTPFHEFHVDNGARMVEFAGWEMPMLYRSIIEEHCQVRTSGGFFDVSHMGRLRFTGPDACRFLDRVCTRQIHGMADDQCRYSIVCNEHGGCRDDVLVYRFGPDEYLRVCNAANRTKLLEHFDAVRGDLDAEWRDETARTAMIAVQGPKVMDLIGDVAPDVASLKRFRFVRKSIMGADVLISRTGYTGEDGVEVIMPATMAVQSVSLLMSTIGGADSPVKPAGLGARDTLRMESAMALYGHEITEQIDPLSAGLTFAVAGEGWLEAFLSDLAADLGGRAVSIPESSRALYHASAVLGCGYLAALLQVAVDSWREMGFSDREALAALLPLAATTVANIGKQGVAASVTGPVVRGDVGTIDLHLAALCNSPPALRVYQALTAASLPLAVQRGVDAGQLEQIRELIDDDHRRYCGCPE